MNTLLIIRDSLIEKYNRFDFVLRPLIRFVIAFIILTVLQSKVGYFGQFSRLVVIAAFSVFCAFFPLGCISVVAGVFLLADMVSISYAMAIFGAGSLMLIFILYYGFKPGTGIIMALVPFAFALDLPFLIPVMLGLNVGIYSVIPAAIGVFIWNMIKYFMENAAVLSEAPAADIADSFVEISRGILNDRYMLAVILAFVVAIIAVSIISNSSMNYSWPAAVTAGIAVQAVVFIAADIIYGGRPLVMDVIGLIASFLISMLYALVFYSVDYRNTERLRFEDDDYVYYVKAVPKIDPYRDDEGYDIKR